MQFQCNLVRVDRVFSNRWTIEPSQWVSTHASYPRDAHLLEFGLRQPFKVRAQLSPLVGIVHTSAVAKRWPHSVTLLHSSSVLG
eukprot:2530634-Amphidinium_carterae.1